jgi:hypothetical protein
MKITPKTLRRLYEKRKLSTTTIAKMFGVVDTTIAARLREFGIPLRKKGPFKGQECYRWKEIVVGARGELRKYSPDHPHADKFGRVAIYKLRFEKKLGRFLTKSEQLTCIDGNYLNTHPSNFKFKETRKNLDKDAIESLIARNTLKNTARILNVCTDKLSSEMKRHGIKPLKNTEKPLFVDSRTKTKYPSIPKLKKLLQSKRVFEICKDLGCKQAAFGLYYRRRLGYPPSVLRSITKGETK